MEVQREEAAPRKPMRPATATGQRRSSHSQPHRTVKRPASAHHAGRATTKTHTAVAPPAYTTSPRRQRRRRRPHSSLGPRLSAVSPTPAVRPSSAAPHVGPGLGTSRPAWGHSDSDSSDDSNCTHSSGSSLKGGVGHRHRHVPRREVERALMEQRENHGAD